MAASDKFYRNQNTLNVVFAVSSILMLLSTGWMFWDDYNRPFKKEQKIFRDVEEELSKRATLAAAPDSAALNQIYDAEAEVTKAKALLKASKESADRIVKSIETQKFKDETQLANRKADYDSLMSFYNIEVDHNGPQSTAAKKYVSEMDQIKKDMDALKLKIEAQAKEIDDARASPYDVTFGGSTSKISPVDAENQLNVAEAKHKKLTDEFDRFAKLAEQKQWKFGDTFRSLPIIDGFASPTKIQQFTLDDLPIDYSFKHVTRYDRCTTCHLGMEKAAYTTDAIHQLKNNATKDPYFSSKLADAIVALTDRKRAKEGKERLSPADIDKLKQQVANGNYGEYSNLAPETINLSDARTAMFAAHPRLDLFVDSNSPHPAEKFGCTACHGGQGSATTFVDATHTPNDVLKEEEWKKQHDWKSIHFWDYPMNPKRFSESACLKCHHQVTDLIRDSSRDEAPKLVKGYNLVRELGCYGCHEIHGQKGGRAIGPDMRLEPDVPLDSMSADERARRLADTTNPPGTFRKVGPSLMRIAEKTNENWTRQWIKAPREFRPDTKMPHYYLQVTNSPDVLPEEQKKFPDTEITAITHYLFSRSRDFLGRVTKYSKDDESTRQADQDKLTDLMNQLAGTALSGEARFKAVMEVAMIKERIAARSAPAPVADAMKLPNRAVDQAVLDEGRHLFSSKGCLACHQHDATAQAKADGAKPIPAMVGESNFGPNLSRLTAKLGLEAGKPETSRAWLVTWLLNPNIHSSRTLMPSVGLTETEADKISLWLMSQKTDWVGPSVDLPDRAALKSLARVYLKNLTARELDRIIDKEEGFSTEELANKGPDADERLLAGQIDDDKLKNFIGKKAISNLGCYACHTISGFEGAKPIGVGLNDWGKKDAERLAFEDADHFITDKFNVVDVRRDLTDAEKKANEALPEGKKMTSWSMKDGKPPYERFYYEAVEHHHREGFLHLKLQEPRSYDYNRIKDWTERTRMPQFKFARIKRAADESDEAYQLRLTKAEAEGREAVMTFVLGMVAEAIPTKFLNQPNPDRSAEIKGRKVLEKYNCAGCHLLNSETMVFKLSNAKYAEKKVEGKEAETVSFKSATLDWLDRKFADYKSSDAEFAVDHRYPDHNVWAGLNPPKDKLIVRATSPELIDDDDVYKGKKNYLVTLTHALRYENLKGEVHDLPAYTFVQLPAEGLEARIPAYGGSFSEMLTKYLQERDPQKYSKDSGYAQSAGPPSLLREGEKTQPAWLYRFLQNPHPIRPLVREVMRMPKFNLGDEDTQALVNYFSSVDKIQNPGVGLTAPYPRIPQRDENFLISKNKEYVDRMKADGSFDQRIKELEPFWKQQLRDKVLESEGRVKAAQARIEQAKKEMKEDPANAATLKVAEDELKAWQKKVETNDISELKKQYEEKEAYAYDAYRLLTNVNLCVKCHQVGNAAVEQEQGPSLAMSADRLRPDWTEKWIAHPQRFLTFKTVMPINFPANAEKNIYTDFHGKEKGFSLEEIQACRDFLMFYPQVAEWPILKYRPATGSTGGK